MTLDVGCLGDALNNCAIKLVLHLTDVSGKKSNLPFWGVSPVISCWRYWSRAAGKVMREYEGSDLHKSQKFGFTSCTFSLALSAGRGVSGKCSSGDMSKER